MECGPQSMYRENGQGFGKNDTTMSWLIQFLL